MTVPRKYKRSPETMAKQYECYSSEPKVDEIKVRNGVFYARLGYVWYKNNRGRWLKKDDDGFWYSIFSKCVPVHVIREYGKVMG